MKTMKKAAFTLAAVTLSMLLATACTTGETTDTNTAAAKSTAAVLDTASADGKGFYAPVNGQRLYYEIHGAGRPLVLIHGGLSTGEANFAALLPELAKTRKVVAVDLQGHGHTPDIDRPLRYEGLADDIAALITHLGLGKADVLGYSLGGGVALQLAARTPDLVNKMIVASATYRSDGWVPETRAGMAAMDPDAMFGSPIHDVYARTAPNPGDWRALVTKTRRLLTENYDWTAQMATVSTPALFLTAENDALYREHIRDLTALLGSKTPSGSRSRLEVVPGTTHYDITYRADLLLPLITPFLDSPATAK
ncbi:alpha/beta fold hydrolase [Nocardia sp. NPDC052566]|uniref:alpha/beta fold hydrolase n=1 Tax=Nocardia sp. NPDC052566 TaxID=3364330 RepID=UPI0037CAF6AD